jgi:low temperature requirement protein LtrA
LHSASRSSGIGVGAGLQLVSGVIAGAALGIVVVSVLWSLYFDVAAIFASTRLAQASGVERARLARDAYRYLHLPMIAGIVFFAFGLETTLHHLHRPLDRISALALCAGVALYLLGHVAFLRVTTGRFRRRTIGAALLFVPHPRRSGDPALAALVTVSARSSSRARQSATARAARGFATLNP